MQVLSLLSFGNFIIFVLLFIYAVVYSSVKSKLNTYAGLVCISLGLWNLFYTFYYMSTTIEQAWFFHKLASVGMYLFPAFTLHFFLILTKREKMISSIQQKIMLYLPAVLFLLYGLFSGKSPLTDTFKQSEFGLGFTYVNRANKISFWITFSFLIIYLGFSLYILFIFGKESKFRVERKQAKLFFVGDSIVLSIGVMTDFIFPLFGTQIPPMANIFTNIFILFFYYIIRKLKVFHLDQHVSSGLILNTLLEPIFVLDEKNEIVQVNFATQQVFGFAEEEMKGKKLSELFDNGTQIEQMDSGEIEIQNEKKEPLHVIVTKNKVSDRINGNLGTVIHIKDITARKQEENKIRILNKKYEKAAKELERLANYDILTGIPNRRMYVKVLEEKMKHAGTTESDFGLIFMDLNGFKDINDRLGHDIGDRALIEIAKRLTLLTKKEDLIARLGGDEFIMLMHFNKKEEIMNKCIEIECEVAKPISFGEISCRFSVATGVAIYSENVNHMEEMLHKADLAMYKHKSHQKESGN